MLVLGVICRESLRPIQITLQGIPKLDKLIKTIIYSILIIIAAILIASAANLIFEFNQNVTLITVFKIFSYCLMMLSISLITMHIVLTRHPHYDIWLVGIAGIIVAILGISGSFV
jgi:hypothetical protein